MCWSKATTIRIAATQIEEWKMSEDSVTYLLRGIPRELWGKVKGKAYEQGMTLREYILMLLEKETITWQEKQMGMEKLQKEN